MPPPEFTIPPGAAMSCCGSPVPTLNISVPTLGAKASLPSPATSPHLPVLFILPILSSPCGPVPATGLLML